MPTESTRKAVAEMYLSEGERYEADFYGPSAHRLAQAWMNYAEYITRKIFVVQNLDDNHSRVAVFTPPTS